MHDILNIFGKNVRKYRRLLNISQEELADRADLHRTYIGMIERAEKNITLVNIEKIANALEVKIEDLLKSENSGRIILGLRYLKNNSKRWLRMEWFNSILL
ncbi:helix-turn-helix transcriptional regulator [Chryseobacterium sp. Chry.R1]|uniref:helix-turn-helix domain-containing protein n=1 Tax=Chryseobacterium sp. Chry.R1 TaxID=3139392 RepID=UPI0031F89CE8